LRHGIDCEIDQRRAVGLGDELVKRTLSAAFELEEVVASGVRRVLVEADHRLEPSPRGGDREPAPRKAAERLAG
jgi:hypothetical protein